MGTHEKTTISTGNHFSNYIKEQLEIMLTKRILKITYLIQLNYVEK